jgi:hypothetical protein
MLTSVTQRVTVFICRPARLAQSVEHETLNLRVVGSSPTLGVSFYQLLISFGLLCFFVPLQLPWRRGLVG